MLVGILIWSRMWSVELYVSVTCKSCLVCDSARGTEAKGPRRQLAQELLTKRCSPRTFSNVFRNSVLQCCCPDHPLYLSTLYAHTNADTTKIPVTAGQCLLRGISPGKSDLLLLRSVHGHTSCTCVSATEPFIVATASRLPQPMSFNPFVTSGTYMSHLQRVFSSPLG